MLPGLRRHQFDISGYRLLRRDRPAKDGGGGVALYVGDHVTVVRKASLELQSLEALVVDVRLRNRNFAIITCYKPPKASLPGFFTDLSAVMERTVHVRSEVLIMGDLNCNMLGNAASSGAGLHLSQFCRNFQLSNLITEVTRPSSGSLLDVILTTHPDRCAASAVIATGASDHYICGAALSTKAPRVPPRKVKFRCTKHTDTDSLTRDLSAADWGSCYFDHTLNLVDADTAWDRWSSLLLPILDRHVPVRYRGVKGDRPPWLTAEIEEAIRLRDRLASLPRTAANRAAFRKQRNRVTGMKRRAMSSFFAEAGDGPNRNPAKFHRRLQQATGLGRTRTSQPKALFSNEDGSLVTDAPEICESFASYFESCVPAAPVLSDADLQDHPSILSIEEKQWAGFSFSFTCEDKVAKVIKNLANNKAPGLDGLTPTLLKLCAPGLASAITDLFNHLINVHQFPGAWKEAALSPVFKKGDSLDRSNYRPILLLLCISKIFEKIMFDQMYAYFVLIFPEDMCGFMKGHSCETALLRLTQECRKWLDAHLPTAIVSLDLSKAFDMVHHQLLLAKLKSFGLCPDSLALLKSYLEGRSARVKIGENLSRRFFLERGVPQGSILGPLLFNIYVIDLSWLLLKCSLIRYADDTSLLLSAKTWAELVFSINGDLRLLSGWFGANFLSLNASKTQAMAIYNRPPAALVTAGKISVDGVPTEWLPSLKMLGVTLNPNLDLGLHVQTIKRKAAASVSLLRQVRRMLSHDALVRLYCQYIRPHLEFASILYVSCSSKALQSLEIFQRSALRQLLGLGRRSDPTPVCGLKSLTSRRSTRLLRLVFQCIHTGSPSYLACYFRTFVTGYNLRGHDLLVVPPTSSDAMKLSFAATGIRLWNGLDDATRQLPKKDFVSYLENSV